MFMLSAGSRTISNSSLLLPRPPEDLPRGFYDSFGANKDIGGGKEAGGGHLVGGGGGGLPDLNIG